MRASIRQKFMMGASHCAPGGVLSWTFWTLPQIVSWISRTWEMVFVVSVHELLYPSNSLGMKVELLLNWVLFKLSLSVYRPETRTIGLVEKMFWIFFYGVYTIWNRLVYWDQKKKKKPMWPIRLCWNWRFELLWGVNFRDN